MRSSLGKLGWILALVTANLASCRAFLDSDDPTVLGQGGASATSSTTTSTGSTGGGGAGGEGCTDAANCPAPGGECVVATCDEGVCGTMNLASGTPVAAQTAGDCKSVQCDGSGNEVTVDDLADPEDDSKECTTDTCKADGTTLHAGLPAGTTCASDGGALCDGAGECVECLTGNDCPELVCVAAACAPPMCDDAVNNGDETDVDCGGSCSPCADLLGCAMGGDCTSLVCDGMTGTCTPPVCTDTTQNQDETDVDCGGAVCPPCVNGNTCVVAGDCASGVCSGSVCLAATCIDTVQNGAETDIDCGGGACAACPVAGACALASDCQSGVCVGGVCQAPTCVDGVANATETDIDCGGAVCPSCATGSGCLTSGDCVSGVCTGGVCQAPTCVDLVQNGSETDVDCGGAGGSCVGCDFLQNCLLGSDCQSGVCSAIQKCITSPSIAQFQPLQGPTTGGTTITITGQGFVPTDQVSIGSVVVPSLTNVTPTQITFTLPAALGNVGLHAVTVSDLNGGITTSSTAFKYYYGQITFATKLDYATGTEPRGLLIKDVSGDNQADVVTSHRTGGTFAVNLGNGDGTFQTAVTYPNGGIANSIAATDLTGDGIVDLATISVTAGGLTILPGTGGGAFAPYVLLGVGGGALTVASGNLNGDPYPDLVVGRRNSGTRGVSSLLGSMAGTLSSTATQPTNNDAVNIRVGSLVAGSLPDVIAAESGGLVVLRGVGDGTFLSPVSYPATSGVAGSDGLAFADFDSDGLMDVAAGGSGVAVLLGDGTGILGPPLVMSTPGNGTSGLCSVDLNGDGFVDILAANANTNNTSILLGNGDGTFAPSFEITAGDRPIEIECFDLDGDGRIDIVTQDDNDAGFSVRLNTSQ